MLLANIIISNNPDSTTLVNEDLHRTATVLPQPGGLLSVRFTNELSEKRTRHGYPGDASAERQALEYVLGNIDLERVFKW